MNKIHNKDSVIEVGMNLFQKLGYKGTSVARILKEARIPKGSFYHFFRSKEDFCLQGLERYAERNVAFMERILQREKHKPLKRIKLVFWEFMGQYKSSGLRWGCLLGGLSQELGRLNDNFAMATKNEFERYIGVLSQCIVEGQSQGEIRSDLNPRELAIHLWTSYNGALVLMQAGLGEEPLEVFLMNGINYLKAE